MNQSLHLHVVLVASLVAGLLAGSAMAQAPYGELPAFPGAEGFGAFTVGGRGGAVHLVTTLADYGPDEEPIEGSLRAAVDAEGPRTIVFRVAGYIELKRPLEIRQPSLTIAGQSAPGEGIGLKNYGLEIYAPEVIIRYLRVRPGDVAGQELDAINVRAGPVIIDHCSVSWGTDETLSVIGQATDVTVQWCLITESLNNSVHHKGAHGYGTLITASGTVSIHHSIYAFHRSRNPRPKDVTLDFRNNLIYGFGDQAGYNYEDFTRMNYVGNTVYPLAYSRDARCAFHVGGTNSTIFAAGNRLRAGDQTIRDDWLLMCPDGVTREALEAHVRVPTALAMPSVVTDAAEDAYRRVLDEAGAVLPVRDAVDERVLALIEAGEGRLIDTQADVGGWPPLAPAAPPPDTDRDGMPDDWETRYGLDPANSADHAEDLDGDGYTNLEESLNATDPTEPFRWLPPPGIHPPSGTAYTDAALTVTMMPPEPGLPVHYTIDGAEPTATSPRYEGPFQVTGDAHVRARVIQDQRPTTAAMAAYDKLDWQDALDDLPAALAPGLHYAYYETSDWDEGPALDTLEPLAVGTAPRVDFEAHDGASAYALVYDGYLKAPRDGIYAFYLHDDPRSRLYIDGRFVTYGKPPGTGPGHVALRAGTHQFHLRSLHEGTGPASRLAWEGPGIARQTIPAAVFSWSPAPR